MRVITSAMTIFLACILVLAVLFFAGPRVKVDTQVKEPELSSDIEAYLQQQESKYTDITEGAEKRIVWAGQAGERTPLSIVYLHGFSATRQELAPVQSQVAEALGANLFETRLTGHGRGSAPMSEGSVNAWLNDTNEAMAIGRRIGQKVVVMGVSTGSGLALWAALEQGEDVAAVILVSPNFGVVNTGAGMLTWPWGKQIAELLIGKQRAFPAQNDLHKVYWTTSYATEALLPMMALVNYVAGFDLSELHKPVQIIYSPKDTVVAPDKIVAAYGRIGSKQKELLPFSESEDPNQHLLAGDILSPGTNDLIISRMVNFLNSLKR